MNKLNKIVIMSVLSMFFFSCLDVKIIDTQEKVLAVIDLPNKNYKLKLIYIPSNATIQSSIQISKIYKNKENEEELVIDYERYNSIDTYNLINDSIFMIVIRDTVSYLGNHPDTMFVKLN